MLEWGSDPLDLDTVHAAREIHLATSYVWWDCLLLASAIALGCARFLSEDLRDGHAIGGLTITDPFAHSPGDILPSR